MSGETLYPSDAFFEVDLSTHPLFREPNLPLITDADNQNAIQASNLDVGELKNPGGEHWAWLGSPRWLSQQRKAINNTYGPVNCLDVCSAVPALASMMEGQHLKRARRKLGPIISEVLNNLNPNSGSPTLGDWLEKAGIEGVNVAHVYYRFESDPLIKSMIEAATRTVTYSFRPESNLFERAQKPNLTQQFAQRLFYEFLSCDYTFVAAQEESRSIEWRWGIDTQKIVQDTSLTERMAELRISPTPEARVARTALSSCLRSAPNFEALNVQAQEELTLAEAGSEVRPELTFLRLLATQLAKDIIKTPNTFRPVTIISSDVQDRAVLIEQSPASFDPITRSTAIYRRGLERLSNPDLHHQVDIFEPLPYASETFTYISAIDSVFSEDITELTAAEQQEYVQKLTDGLSELYRILKPGGIVLIWPFGPRVNEVVDLLMTYQVIDKVARFSPLPEVAMRVLTPEQVTDWGTEMEQQIVHHRPLMQKTYRTSTKDGSIDLMACLTIMKPFGSSSSVGRSKTLRYDDVDI